MRSAAREPLIGLLFTALTGAALRVLLTPAGPLPNAPRAADSQPSFPALPTRADGVASYDIDAKLDTTKHRVEGHEKIHFVNRSSAPLSELWFHLYLNA